MNPMIEDKYRIISEIGRGGMGIVYEAIHVGLGHRVAMKFLTAPEVKHESVLARFAREARAGANISSEHVARVFDLGMANDVPFLVMELLEGDDLANVLEDHPVLRIDDAVRFIFQAVSAIAEAHAMGIVHRDLKPDNLFLQARRGAAPIVKVLDFGLAKIRTQIDAAQTETELVFGTPKYMAPEQLKSTANAGPEADIWALGAILYQMLTGRRPFDGPILSVVVADVLTKDPTPIRDLRPEVPPELDAIVMSCLRRDCSERPTATELAEQLLPFAPGCDELAARIRATSTTAPSSASQAPAPARHFHAPPRKAWRRLEWATLLLGLLALFFAGMTVSLLRAKFAMASASTHVAASPKSAAPSKIATQP